MNFFWITIFLISIGYISFKIWLKWIINWNRSYKCLIGKTVIITGANRGIGYYAALDFAKRGARVILACRNKDAAEEARWKLVEATGNTNVVVKIVDFTSLYSVRKFAKDINETEERLDILINNAGIYGTGCFKTKDGLDLYMQTHHFGPFLLTLLLIGLIKKSAPSRIINVSSLESRYTALNVDNLNFSDDTSIAYANSKLCNILFTNELARKLHSCDIDINSLHPGLVHTGIHEKLEGMLGTILRICGKLFFRTPEEGAQTIIYLAVSSEIKGVTGQYFDNCEVAWCPPVAKEAADQKLAKKVWEKSEEFVKLTQEEQEQIRLAIAI